MTRPTVLIVDDHEDFLVSARMILEHDLPMVDLVTDTDPERALAILERRRVDVAVVDYRMPRMDGLTFLLRAADIAPHAVRVLITAYPDLVVLVRAINEADIARYVRKPLTADHLVGVIRDLVNETNGTGCPAAGAQERLPGASRRRGGRRPSNTPAARRR